MAIRKTDLTPIGKIIKPHGIHGEMSFSFTTDIFETDKLPFLFLEIEGIMVPFVVTAYRLKSDTTGLINLQNITTKDIAAQYEGIAIYVHQDDLRNLEAVNIESEYFVGFRLSDKQLGDVGTIIDIDRSTANALFVVQQDEEEILIPATEDFIIAIDHKAMTILLDLPEGLLEL